MRKSSIPRAVARAATTVALAGAVTVPTLGSTPAFASSGAGTTAAARPAAAATSVAPHVWVPEVAPAAQTNSVRPAALSPNACRGKSKGHIVKWYFSHVPLAPVPLRCGTDGFGFNKIRKKHWSPTIDEDIANTLAHYTKAEWQGPTTTAYILRDLAPCEGQFRVVVQYASYGSTGIKGIITAYHEDRITLKPGEVALRC